MAASSEPCNTSCTDPSSQSSAILFASHSDRHANLNGSIQARLKKKMAICYDRLFNCAIVVLPAMFVLPILVWSLERLGLVTVPHGSRLETILSYYFVLCWATMFSFSFLFCARSLCEADLRDPISSTRTSDANNSTTMPVHLDLSSTMDCSETTTAVSEAVNDLPPTYEEAIGNTGSRQMVTINMRGSI